MSRKTLPHRETTDCFLIYKGKMIARDQGHFIQFLGGGLDKGETPEKASVRECIEEVGAKLKGKVKKIITIDWDWFPKWANNKKKKSKIQKI